MNLLNRKTKKDQIDEALVGASPEPSAEPPVEPMEALSPEEQRLKEARERLEAVQAQRLDAMTVREAEEAKRKLDEAQANLDKARSEQDRRFHEANRLVMEAEADIQLAKQQKVVFEEVSSMLAGFKATDVGKDMPDDVAVMFAVLLSASRHNTNWDVINNAVVVRDFMREFVSTMGKVTTYYAYKRRMGIK